MIELPESYVLADQINKTLIGKTITHAQANTHSHGFATYSGDPSNYGSMLKGKKINSANADTGFTCGGNIEILCDNMSLVTSTPIKYHIPNAKLPKKHQLLLTFDDKSHLSCTVQMWGCMLCGPKGEFEKITKPSPLSDDFGENYFDKLFWGANPGLSAKAFLATEQRIPGLGNGVLHDILWNAEIHPKRKLETFKTLDKEKLYKNVKFTLLQMRNQGGRDTEKDLFGQPGGYKTILSKNTLAYQCPRCGDGLIRQSYLGGNIYFCPTCQKL